jgi:hypothetical protein
LLFAALLLLRVLLSLLLQQLLLQLVGNCLQLC